MPTSYQPTVNPLGLEASEDENSWSRRPNAQKPRGLSGEASVAVPTRGRFHGVDKPSSTGSQGSDGGERRCLLLRRQHLFLMAHGRSMKVNHLKTSHLPVLGDSGRLHTRLRRDLGRPGWRGISGLDMLSYQTMSH